MRNIEVARDLDFTGNLFTGDYSNKNYDMIYTRTNEYLDALFDEMDVNGKDVLTVLASSDQLFKFLISDVKSIKTYDINKLTKYFYYLRKWNIIYNNELYLPNDFNGVFIFNLLFKVKPSCEDEEMAYKYWYNFIMKYPPFLYRMIFHNGLKKKNSYIDLDKLRNCLETFDLKFECLDMTDKLNIDGKYDMVFTSNMSEYFFDDLDKINNYKNNLYNCLNDGGKVVSSHMIYKSIPFIEYRVFMPYFICDEFREYYDEDFGFYFPIGYSYQKKKSDVNKK